LLLEHTEELTKSLPLLTLIFEDDWRACLKVFFIYLITLFYKFKAMQIFHGEICHELAILPLILRARTIAITDGIVEKLRIVQLISIESIKIIFVFVEVVLKESSLLSTLTHRNRIMTISWESVCGRIKRSNTWCRV